MKGKIAAGWATAFLLLAGRLWAGQGGKVEYIEVPNRPLNLKDCIAIALDESPALEASRLDVTSATEEARAARSALLPKIDGQASYQLFSGSPSGKFAIVNQGGIAIGGNGKEVDGAGVEFYSAHLGFPLFKDGSIFGLNTPPAQASKLALRRNLAWQSKLRREEVIARITDAFINTVSAENRAGYARRRVELLQKQVDVTREQQKQGLMLPIDLKLAQGQLSGAQTLATILRQQAVAGRIELARALGIDNPNDLRLSNELPEPPEPPSAEQLLASANLEMHPSLGVQKATIDQAHQDYRLEKYRLYPAVTLDGNALHADDFGSGSSEIYLGAVTVDVPIFDFGTQMSTTRSKLAKYQAERARLGAVKDEITNDIVGIYQSIYVLSQNILSLQEEVAKADRDLQITSSQQQQGIAPPLTAIEKELRLIAKRDNLDGLEVRRLMLYAALQKAAGGAWKWIQ